MNNNLMKYSKRNAKVMLGMTLGTIIYSISVVGY